MQQENSGEQGWRLNQNTGKLIYFGDPMCSWCWGIVNALDELRTAFSQELSFEIVMGGLRPGGGDPWNKQMKEFLRNHWEHVTAASGQKFNYGLLEKESFNYDTEPSCRAVVVARALKPEIEFEFFKAVQHKFYVENEDPAEEEFYRTICEKFSIPFNQFSTLFESDEFKEIVTKDFNKSRQYGVRGFPSVVFENHDKATMITNGFASFEQMAQKVNALLTE